MIRNSWIVLAAMAATGAWAQGTLDVETTVQKESVTIGDDGEELRELVPAATVVPGERVIYTITFRNTGAEAADNVVITNPIAESLSYVDGSAFGPGMRIEFSVDGGQSFAAASALTVLEDGEERPADAADYTHVRWVLEGDLAAGAQGVARFSAILK